MKKYYNIEFLRFVFAIIIVYFHLLNSNIISSVGENFLEPYYALQKSCRYCSLLVEGFLVISGYFLYKSFMKNQDKPFIELFIDKIVRLWPVLFVYTVIAVLKYGTAIEDAFLDLFFLRATGISMYSHGIIWYVGPFFWCSIFILALLKYLEKRSLLVISVIAYFGYALNLNTYSGGIGRNVEYVFISMGMLRVFSTLAIGCFLAAGMEAYEKRFGKNSDAEINTENVKMIAFTMVETVTFYALFKILFFGKSIITNGFTAIILFTILVFCMITGHGIWAKLLNRKIFGKLGRYSYSIYVMQQIAFYMMRKSFWKNTAFLNENVMLSLIISTAFTILVGIVVYHTVEAPAVKMYNKWKASKIIIAEEN